MAHDPHFDIAVLDSLLEGDRQMMCRFATRFIGAAHSAMAEIDGALAAGDLAQLRHLGHRTLSAALTVGAVGIAGLCRQLERLPHDAPDGLGAARVLVADLHSALAATSASMADAGLC
ncbi:MAG TPA: Hpt domain-containing protein [Telluria sp.]|nr:Hpt domain-containing protein [Telluria sp.]